MDCALCARRFRQKDRCPGCRGEDADKAKTVVGCVIANCPALRETGVKYCSHRCAEFPCKRLKDLDKRYGSKYHMSMLDNLDAIERSGIRAFVRGERDRWTCPECGALLCVHTGRCSECDREIPSVFASQRQEPCSD
jgi:hypothetical protein